MVAEPTGSMVAESTAGVVDTKVEHDTCTRYSSPSIVYVFVFGGGIRSDTRQGAANLIEHEVAKSSVRGECL